MSLQKRSAADKWVLKRQKTKDGFLAETNTEKPKEGLRECPLGSQQVLQDEIKNIGVCKH